LYASGIAPFPNLARLFLEPHDVIVVIGARVFYMYYYQAQDPIPAEATLVHVHPDPWEVGKTYPTEVGIISSADNFIEALTTAVGSWPGDVAERARERRVRLESEGADARPNTELWGASEKDKTPLTAAGIVASIVEVFDDATFVDESVTSSIAPKAIPELKDSDSIFGNKAGGLGWGVGAAVGVSLGLPGRRIVCTLGDGSLMYCPQAMYTAARQKLPILYVVMNNAGYAIIKSGTRAQKGRAYETDTYLGMDLVGPEIDFVSLAHGLGLGAASASNPDELRNALRRALTHDGPFLLDCKLDRTIPDLPF
jgi:benzoylformate decarboxylase